MATSPLWGVRVGRRVREGWKHNVKRLQSVIAGHEACADREGCQNKWYVGCCVWVVYGGVGQPRSLPAEAGHLPNQL